MGAAKSNKVVEKAQGSRALMDRFGEFFLNHLVLFALLFAIVAMLIWTFLGDRIRGIRSVDHAGLTHLLNRNNALLIDIRPAAEYERGHILGAVHVAENDCQNRLPAVGKEKDRPAVVYCQTGMNAGKVCKLLQAQGFSEVYTLKGGLNSWLNAGLPTSKD
jgi:rhodanese-related sulfurtransferase